MADENIGGIEVSASISSTTAEAQLEALLSKMQAAARQMQAALTITPHIAQAPQPQQAQATRAAAPPPISYGAGSGTRAAAQQGQTSQVRAINAELAKTGEYFDAQSGEIRKITEGLAGQRREMASVTQAARVQQTEFTQGASSLVPSIDTKEAKEQLAAFLTEFKTAMEEAQASATINVSVEGSASSPSGRGRRRRGSRTAAAGTPPSGEDEEEQGRLGFQTRMAAFELRTGQQHEARIQGTRRTAAQRAFSESERQRKAELAAQSKQYDSLATLATRYFDDQEKRAAKMEPLQAQAARQQTLTQAGYEREQRAGGTADTSTARRRTPAEITELRRMEALRAAGRFGGTPTPQEEAAQRGPDGPRGFTLNGRPYFNGGGTPPPRGGGPPRPLPPEFDVPPPPRFSAADRARAASSAARDEEAVKQANRGRTPSEAQREREIEANITRQRTSITAAGRTGRTESYGLGALFGGSQGAFIEASQRQASARRDLNRAEVDAEPIRRRLAEYDVAISKSTGARVGILQKERDAFASRKDVSPILEREAKATKGLEQANADLQKLQGPSSIARNLLAGAAGGAAFGIAMAGINEAVKILAPTLAEVTDSLGGFTARSTAVTGALAQQTIAQKGNVDAVLAQQAATAGLSASAADYLDTQLKLTTEVKAGALAQKQSSDLFKAGHGTNQNIPEGLNGGYGGLFGTPFLAGTGPFGGGAGFRETTAGNIRQFGGASTSTTGRFGDVPGTVNDILGSLNPFGENFANPGAQIQKRDSQASLAAGNTPALTKQIDDLNEAAKRAATATGQASAGTFAYTNDTAKVAQAIAIAKAAGDDLGASMASMGLVVQDASGNIADFTTQMQAWSQAAVGKGIPAAEELGKIASANETQREKEARASLPALTQQFNYSDPALIRQLARTRDLSLQTQLPAQAQLQNLAAPPTPIGTGIPGGAGTPGQQKAIDLQKQLNAYYMQGQQAIENTYKPEIIAQWGAAAGNVFQGLLNDITSTGKEISGLQADISNTSIVQQTKEYNYQLKISERTLSDINGLNNQNLRGAGQSYLGTLEKQNLALSRQGQQLQFNLSQRQINFQVALAGFETPGVTGEERAARVKEAKIEADYAQKQLDIQTKMFGNQVQIVDIQNLRQGADLARQIGLLISGHKASIRIAVDQQELIRAQQRSEQLVKQAGKFLSDVDTVAATGISHIADMETAAGRALTRTEVKALKIFNKFVSDITTAMNTQLNPGDTGGGGNIGAQELARKRDLNGNGIIGKASGFIGNVTGATSMVMGEAGTETVAILRNPRAASGFGGGMTNIFNITGNTVRSDDDLDMIVRKVTKALGRDAALKGLRNN